MTDGATDPRRSPGGMLQAGQVQQLNPSPAKFEGYDTFKNYKFEVWDQNFIGDPFKVGSGTAKRFIGVWYRVVTC